MNSIKEIFIADIDNGVKVLHYEFTGNLLSYHSYYNNTYRILGYRSLPADHSIYSITNTFKDSIKTIL